LAYHSWNLVLPEALSRMPSCDLAFLMNSSAEAPLPTYFFSSEPERSVLCSPASARRWAFSRPSSAFFAVVRPSSTRPPVLREAMLTAADLPVSVPPASGRVLAFAATPKVLARAPVASRPPAILAVRFRFLR